MALNSDLGLKHFREEWQKELSNSKATVSVRSPGQTSGTSRDNTTKSIVESIDRHQDLKSGKQNESSIRDQCVGSSFDSRGVHNETDDYEYGGSGGSNKYNKDERQGQASVSVGTGKSQNNTHEDVDQYYPFKILSQFLNEAPRKVKPVRKRSAREVDNNAEATYSKKKYFENLSRNQDKKNCEESHSREHVRRGNDNNGDDGKRMLDLFIADLDEINEIPFFDSSLPREVAFKIFQYLDMPTLCICSQVSRSWKSLADDELLWCHLCHKMGFNTESKVFQDQGWKERVQKHIQQQKALEANWKARVGKPYQLKFARGGVVCAVASHHSSILAGYTSCQVKSWNTQTGEECTFNASNTSLVIDENAEDLGCIQNEIRHISTTPTVTAASFRHGFVDIWRNEGDVDPIHTISFNNPDVSSLCAHDLDKCCSLVAACQNTRIQVTRVDDLIGSRLMDIDMKSPVYKMLWVDGCKDKTSLLVSCQNSVWMKDFHGNSPVIEGVVAQDDLPMVEVHNLFYAPITCLGVREGFHQVGVGFNMITGASSQPKLNVYDLTVMQPQASLTGHTWFISCMDMPSALPQQLATGSGDRKVRLFDLRAGTTPLTTLIGHSAKVTCIQMDEVKVVSGDEAGFVCVWDVRTGRKLWDIHNRHPVQYCRFNGRLLIIGNIPYNKFPENEKDEFESVSSLRYRGTVQFYDFLADQQTQGVPEICLSSYNEPEAFDYNLGLAVPYDSL